MEKEGRTEYGQQSMIYTSMSSAGTLSFEGRGLMSQCPSVDAGAPQHWPKYFWEIVRDAPHLCFLFVGAAGVRPLGELKDKNTGNSCTSNRSQRSRMPVNLREICGLQLLHRNSKLSHNFPSEAKRCFR